MMRIKDGLTINLEVALCVEILTLKKNIIQFIINSNV